MKRTFAVVVAAATASTSIWLAGTQAASARPKQPSATLRVAPNWTYQGSGRLAVIAACSNRADVRVISSKLLPLPVTLPKAGNLLIKVTNKTRPEKYRIMLSCVGEHHMADAADIKWVKILKLLSGFSQPDQPSLPKHFKPAVTVSSGPPARKK
jgi:hypothetical protein